MASPRRRKFVKCPGFRLDINFHNSCDACGQNINLHEFSTPPATRCRTGGCTCLCFFDRAGYVSATETGECCCGHSLAAHTDTPAVKSQAHTSESGNGAERGQQKKAGPTLFPDGHRAPVRKGSTRSGDNALVNAAEQFLLNYVDSANPDDPLLSELHHRLALKLFQKSNGTHPTSAVAALVVGSQPVSDNVRSVSLMHMMREDPMVLGQRLYAYACSGNSLLSPIILDSIMASAPAPSSQRALQLKTHAISIACRLPLVMCEVIASYFFAPPPDLSDFVLMLRQKIPFTWPANGKLRDRDEEGLFCALSSLERYRDPQTQSFEFVLRWPHLYGAFDSARLEEACREADRFFGDPGGDSTVIWHEGRSWHERTFEDSKEAMVCYNTLAPHLTRACVTDGSVKARWAYHKYDWAGRLEAEIKARTTVTTTSFPFLYQDYMHWVQSSNPTTEKLVAGYQPVDCPYAGNGWGGLVCDSHGHAVMHGSSSLGTPPGWWWYAVGVHKFHSHSKIPAFNPAGGMEHAGGFCADQVELWVRKPHTQKKKKEPMP